MPVYLYLYKSALLVINPKKQLPNAKSISKYLDHKSSVWQIYKFNAPREGLLLLLIKQCPLNVISGNG